MDPNNSVIKRLWCTYFTMKTCCGTHQKCFTEALLMSATTCFHGEIRKDKDTILRKKCLVWHYASSCTAAQAFKWVLLFIFSLLFLCSYSFLLFSENALLSLFFSPKMFEVTINCNFFPGLLRSVRVCKS